MKKIAIVVPRYVDDETEGGEVLTKLLAGHLKKWAHITVLTTQVWDYDSWRNDIKIDREISEGITIRRFPVDAPRNLSVFNNLTLKLFERPNHAISTEIEWLKNQGSYSSSLLNYLHIAKREFDLYFFVGYSNPLTYFGLPAVKDKAILVPLTHREPELQFKVFDKIFSSPLVILPSTKAEKEIIKDRFIDLPPLFTMGVGTDEPAFHPSKAYFKIRNPYMLFIGRLSKPKGFFQLINYYSQFKNNFNANIDLVLVGPKVESLPRHKHIKYLGVVSKEEKYFLISQAEFVVNPSFYESLSLVILESWSQGVAVLVNGDCEVLRSQVDESNGGLYYTNYQEFAAIVLWLLRNKKRRLDLGKNGYEYVKKCYQWQTVEKKYEALINSLPL